VDIQIARLGEYVVGWPRRVLVAGVSRSVRLGIDAFRRPEIPEELRAKIRAREEARVARQWAADAIRDEFAAQGLQLMDTADSIDWYRRT
jgi:cysteinyl-tRNA synthetase